MVRGATSYTFISIQKEAVVLCRLKNNEKQKIKQN